MINSDEFWNELDSYTKDMIEAIADLSFYVMSGPDNAGGLRVQPAFLIIKISILQQSRQKH